ncbi:Glyoxylase, beta-lactamase superfamily II [Arboricoccus pini]|uniref:Glyoxylase, beta-lactamase superfamily II n=1 Tax=Arboricoccus pini TaxID=1963835 RepID=A0A212QQ89_9PROT|nr:MBL fold metallo-hydrolase [Arboricoccus pini]SNB61640.1 Glyoxylase, beta-lactamase superfamily II [Arboricoccus pini]
MREQYRRIGDHEIMILEDGILFASPTLLSHVEGENGLAPHLQKLGEGNIPIVVNMFLIQGPGGVILIDSGLGGAQGPDFGKARLLLKEKGIGPDDVDHILLTHFHTDHAEGLLYEDRSYFPRALVHYPPVDLAYFTNPEERDKLPEARRAAFAVAARVVAAYAGRMAPIDAGIVSLGFKSMPLPGHTPGHTGYLLDGQDESLLIWGDVMHLDDRQAADTELGLAFDIDLARAAATRKLVVEQAARNDWVVAGSHIKGFNRFRRDGAGFVAEEA